MKDVEFIEEIIGKINDGDRDYALEMLGDWKRELQEKPDREDIDDVLRYLRVTNRLRNDRDAYRHALVCYALGEEDKPDPADYGQ